MAAHSSSTVTSAPIFKLSQSGHSKSSRWSFIAFGVPAYERTLQTRAIVVIRQHHGSHCVW
jgi:hypothetical protein